MKFSRHTAPAGCVPAWLAGIVKDTAAQEQHHKVKRRALQLAALPLLADRECTSDSQTINGSEAAELKTGKSVAGADAMSGAQPSTALEEIQALQKQLQHTQHAEVCSLRPLGKHASSGRLALQSSCQWSHPCCQLLHTFAVDVAAHWLQSDAA